MQAEKTLYIPERQFFENRKELALHASVWAIFGVIAVIWTAAAIFGYSGNNFGITLYSWQAWTIIGVCFAAALGVCIFFTAKGKKYGRYMLFAFIAALIVAGLLGAPALLPAAQGVFITLPTLTFILLLAWDFVMLMYAMILFGTDHAKLGITILIVLLLFIALTIAAAFICALSTPYVYIVAPDGHELIFSYDNYTNNIYDVYMPVSSWGIEQINSTPIGHNISELSESLTFFDGGFKINFNGVERVFSYLN